MESYADTNTGAMLETVLRDDLAQGDAVLGTIGPILRHLVDTGANSLFSEEIVAGVRGMATDIAGQLLAELSEPAGVADPNGHQPGDIAALTGAIVANPALLTHLHALALEWQLSRRLQARLALDPVLPPLLQSLVASNDAVTAGMAMSALAAQARFCQTQRRMQLALEELPGDLLHGVLVAMRALAGTESEADARAARAEAAIRGRCDEGRSRLGLLYRLVAGLGGEAATALAVTHAGVALFLTALARTSGSDRDLAALAVHDSQLARLALALRAAGLKPQAVEAQFLALHPDIALPEHFDRMGADRAAALLAASGIHGNLA